MPLQSSEEGMSYSTGGREKLYIRMKMNKVRFPAKCHIWIYIAIICKAFMYKLKY